MIQTSMPTQTTETGPGPAVVAVEPTAIVVSLTDPLGQALYQTWRRADAADALYGFKRFTFDEWLAERLKDICYGPGIEPGNAADWLRSH